MPCPRHYATRLLNCNQYYPDFSQHKFILNFTSMKPQSLYSFFTPRCDCEVCSCCGSALLTFIATSCPWMMDHSLIPNLQWLDSPAVSSAGCSWVCGTCVLVRVCIRVCGLCMNGIPGSQGIHLLIFSKYCQSVSQSCTDLHKNSTFSTFSP